MVKLSKKDRTDPNAPKKPSTAYFSWLHTSGVRTEVLAEHPEWTGKQKISECGKICGAKWKALDDAEKKKWQDKAAEEKAKWTVKMDAYKKTASYKNFQEEKKLKQIKKAGKKRTLKDPNFPKRPMSAYFLFLADLRRENPDMKMTEQSKVGGAKWKAMTDEQKKPYVEKAAALKAEHEEAVTAYKKTDLYAKFQAKNEEFKADRKKTLKKLKK